MLDSFWREARRAARGLAGRPLDTAVTTLTLVVGAALAGAAGLTLVEN